MRLDEIRERRDRAQKMVSDLCHGRKSWVMSIPPRRGIDPDLVIGDALRDTKVLLTIAEAAVKLRDLRNAEPHMVYWDAYTKWKADVADAVTAVENAVDAFELPYVSIGSPHPWPMLDTPGLPIAGIEEATG